MKRENVTLSREELKRVKGLERVAGGGMTTTEAVESLGITSRQFRRLKAKYAKEGEEGVIHGNRGRKPEHALSDEIRSLVARLHEEKYSDSNFCHCADLLREHEGVNLSPSSVGRILKSVGKVSGRSVKHRSGKHRRRDRRRCRSGDRGYSAAIRQGIEKYGVPLVLYTDKHTIFRSPNEKLTIDEELNGEEIPLSNAMFKRGNEEN
jgi:transposase